MLNTIKNTVFDLFDKINPLEVSWGDRGDVVIFFLNVGLFLITIIAIIAVLFYWGRIVKFLRNVAVELKNVEWLKRGELYKLSLIAVILIVLFTLFLLLTDQAFLELRNLIILQ